MKKTTRMKRRKWARYALPEGFREREYPKDSSYHTTSRNMMGRKNPSYGCQTIFTQYKRPASIEEVKSGMQKKGEALHSYIQRWSIIKNSTEDVSDERAVDAFASGLRRSDLVEELGRTKPKTVSELMEIDNRFADGVDAYHSKRARSPEYDRSSRQRN
jgi:hypothetical protein